MPARVRKPAFSLEDLESNIGRLFEAAQTTAACHQKNTVALYKLQIMAVKHVEGDVNGQNGELEFTEIILKTVMRALSAGKKGNREADRIVKFVRDYLCYINSKALDERGDEDDQDNETPSSRLVQQLCELLIRGFVAQNKDVRYRTMYFVQEIVNVIGEIDTVTYDNIKDGLLDRLKDKEAFIRAGAAGGLCKLARNADPEDHEESEEIFGALLEALVYDPSADVRRLIVVNIPVNNITIPTILDSARDQDAKVRKSAFLALHNNTIEDNGFIGLMHPKILTIQRRETVLKLGLHDRDETVRRGAVELVSNWIKHVQALPKPSDDDEMLEGPEVSIESNADVVAFLKLFDLLNPTVPAKALGDAFLIDNDKSIVGSVDLGGSFWSNLSPETALLARVFAEFALLPRNNGELDDILPVIKDFAYYIQESCNRLEESSPYSQEYEDETIILRELLTLAEKLDYADERGRNEMFTLMRDILSKKTTKLSDSIQLKCMDVLALVAAKEREFIRIVVEIVQDLRDDDSQTLQDDDPDASFSSNASVAKRPMIIQTRKDYESLSSREKEDADNIDKRCLSLCTGMLRHINSSMEKNSTLEGILADLVLPTMERINDDVMQELSLTCLALIALVTKSTAESTIAILFDRAARTNENSNMLQVTIMKAIFDMLVVHGRYLMAPSDNAEKVVKFLRGLLKAAESDDMQALMCEGLSKVVLEGVIQDMDVLEDLFEKFIEPDTEDNLPLRLCLRYFFPTFSHISLRNQQTLVKLFLSIYRKLPELRQKYDDDLSDCFNPTKIINMFFDWTDFTLFIGDKKNKSEVHVYWAIDIIKLLLDRSQRKAMNNSDKKALWLLLPKLSIPSDLEDGVIHLLKLFVDNLLSRDLSPDQSATKAVTKMQATLSKLFEKQLQGFSEAHLREMNELDEAFTWLDGMIPLEGEEEIEVKPKVREGRKRRSASAVSAVTSSKGRDRTKRRRLSSTPDSEDSDFEHLSIDREATPAAKTRTLPRRHATKTQPILISSDSDEDEVTATVVGKKTRAAQLDEEIDDLLDDNIAFVVRRRPIRNSIVDEDSEDEVDDLLAGDDD